MIVLRLGKRRPRSVAIVLPGVEVEFLQCGLRDGSPGMCGEVPDDHPQFEEIRAKLAAMPNNYRILNDPSFIAWVGERPTTGTTAPSPLDPPMPVANALANGWTTEDLLGAGEGEQWGNAGGFSNRAGLTMVDMTLCIPPPGWADKVETHWPWEVEGWKPPGLDFKPPKVPSKVEAESESEAGAEPEPEGPPDETDPRIAHLWADGKTPDDTALAEALAALEEPEVEGAVEPEPVESVESETGAPAVDNGAVLADYGTEEEVAAARRLIALLTEESGATPSQSKANYHLGKHGLPTVKKAEFEALLVAA